MNQLSRPPPPFILCDQTDIHTSYIILLWYNYVHKMKTKAVTTTTTTNDDDDDGGRGGNGAAKSKELRHSSVTISMKR